MNIRLDLMSCYHQMAYASSNHKSRSTLSSNSCARRADAGLRSLAEVPSFFVFHLRQAASALTLGTISWTIRPTWKLAITPKFTVPYPLQARRNALGPGDAAAVPAANFPSRNDFTCQFNHMHGSLRRPPRRNYSCVDRMYRRPSITKICVLGHDTYCTGKRSSALPCSSS